MALLACAWRVGSQRSYPTLAAPTRALAPLQSHLAADTTTLLPLPRHLLASLPTLPTFLASRRDELACLHGPMDVHAYTTMDG